MPKAVSFKPSKIVADTALVNRFFESVTKEGPIHPVHGQCWLWTGHSSKANRYGKIRIGKLRLAAHRASWYIHYGVVPSLCVLHKCDTPTCVNPKHLFLGTQQDNIKDMESKERTTKGRSFLHGELNGYAKLTEQDVLEIRRRYKYGNGHLLAKEFGVGAAQISRIIHGSRWERTIAKSSLFE